MHLALSAPDHRPFLEQEVVRALPSAVLEPLGDSMLALKGTGGWSETRKALGLTAFARQWLPEARPFPVPSIRAAAETLVTALIGSCPTEALGVCRWSRAGESPTQGVIGAS